MKNRYLLLAGPLAVVIFFFGMVLIPLMIPGYSQIHQTVSEIGEAGSPARIPFTGMLLLVAACILLFGYAIRSTSIRAGISPLAGYVTAWMAVASAGVGVFAFPSPLHNYFGLSELIAFQAPLVLAINWRRIPWAKNLVRLSVLMFVLMWIAIAFNLSVFDRSGSLWAAEKPVYGLIQRGLFFVWFVWCAAVGLMLFRLLGRNRLLPVSSNARVTDDFNQVDNRNAELAALENRSGD